MNLRVCLVALALAASTAGCGPATKPQSPEPSESPKRSEAATARVLFVYTNDEEFMRVAYELTNPSAKYRTGLETRWKAFDAEDIIVGSFGGKQPPIPPHSSVVHVGGSGQLSGNADRVSLEITDQGGLRRTGTKPAFRVSDVTFKLDEWNTYDGAQDYDVSAVLTALVDAPTKGLNVEFLLRDADGKIVGADWAEPTDGDVPDELAKGEKVRISATVYVENGKVPEKVEAGLDY